MINRSITGKICDSLRDFPVVGIIGPRQSGKTTLAKMIADSFAKPAIYIDLERISDQQKLQDAELFFIKNTNKLIILDEIQRQPELFPLLRSLVDLSSENGRFLILGSASPVLSRQASESLAGRICYHQLTGFLIEEIGYEEKDLDQLWFRGGLPRSFLSESDEKSQIWRENFIRTHLERDIPSLGFQITPSIMQRFWQMIAHCHGQLWNASKIASSLGVSPTTARKYLDVLQETFMIRQLEPYYPNIKKRIVKSPKIYIRDSGLLHTLLNINSFEELLGHPLSGFSWEGWIIEQLMAIIPNRWSINFYRTSAGAEIDLVIYPVQLKPPIAIEIKRSLAPELSKGFWNAYDDLKPQSVYVIYPGKDSYPIAENVWTLPVTELDKICRIQDSENKN